MVPRLLLAPAGHGKTEHIIQRIRGLLAEELLAPVIIVVPNSIQANGFRKRLSASGGALGVEVHTFHTLYAELLVRAGQPIPLLLDPVRIRLLRAILDDLCERGKMSHYAGLRDKPGFIALLRNSIEELKRARIFPDEFSAAVKGLSPRLEEFALVYTAYQDWLQDQDWADNEGRGWLAAIALESTPTLGTDTRFLAVSGFDEFNPTQLAVLSLLARRAEETLITLTGDIHNPQRPAHHRFHRAQATLTSALKIQPEVLESTSMLSKNIARIETNLFESVLTEDMSLRGRRSPARSNPPVVEEIASSLLSVAPRTASPLGDDIEFLEAQTRALEVRSALRWIKARIVRDGMEILNVAILARDLEPYRPFLEETAEEFGIPLRVVGGQPLIENPAVVALLALLSLPAENWPRRALLESWRSPYFDWTAQGIDPESVATLDEISRVGRVSQGLSQWAEAFAMWEKKKAVVDEEGEMIRSLAFDDQVMEKFEAFVDLLTPPGHASLKEYVAFVESLIGDDPALTPGHSPEGRGGNGLNVVANARANVITAERDVSALRAFKDVLRGLVLAESVLNDESLGYADFFQDLRGAVEGATFSIPTESGVFAASALDGRGLSFEAVVLMGLSEGEFPKQEREDILLREHDRAILRKRGLPLETKLHGDEATFFYQAVTRGRQRLLLTRPYLADDGQAWEPSPFWDQVFRLNGSSPIVRVRGEAGLTNPAEAASQVEWVESAGEFDVHIQNGIEALQARMALTAGGIYEGDASTPWRGQAGSVQGFDLSERFGAGYGWSASRLESYGTCPFEFFVSYAMELEPRALPEEGFDVRVLGSMLHKVLEEVFATDDPLKNLPEKAGEVFATAPRDYGFRPTALWEMQKIELTHILENTVRALDEVSQGYRPLHLEARFGMGNPSLLLQTSAGEVRLHGYIDRLDVAPDGSLRVIDYKAGSMAISANHLKEGRRLQLPIYALAARDALGLGKVSGGFYWHIQRAEASSFKLERFEGGIEGAFEMAIDHIGKYVAGIRAGHFEPKPPEEGCPSYCPAVGFCWRYKRGF